MKQTSLGHLSFIFFQMYTVYALQNLKGYSNPAGGHLTLFSQCNLSNCWYTCSCEQKCKLCMCTEESICMNYAIGFCDADILLVGSLCCSGLCATCAQTLKLSEIVITWFDLLQFIFPKEDKLFRSMTTDCNQDDPCYIHCVQIKRTIQFLQ